MHLLPWWASGTLEIWGLQLSGCNSAAHHSASPLCGGQDLPAAICRLQSGSQGPNPLSLCGGPQLPAAICRLQFARSFWPAYSLVYWRPLTSEGGARVLVCFPRKGGKGVTSSHFYS